MLSILAVLTDIFKFAKFHANQWRNVRLADTPKNGGSDRKEKSSSVIIIIDKNFF